MDVVYANGTIGSEDVLRKLAMTGQAEAACRLAARDEVVHRFARKRNLSVSDDELQETADALRQTMGLHTADATFAFLRRWDVSDDSFERACETLALEPKVRRALAPDSRVEEYFVLNRSRFDRAHVSAIVVAEPSLADELLMQIEEDGEDFHALARRHSTDERGRRCGGYLGMLAREDLPSAVSSKVFNAEPGDVLGPFPVDKAHQLLLVEEVIRAELDDTLRAAIREIVFDEWLSESVGDDVRVEEV